MATQLEIQAWLNTAPVVTDIAELDSKDQGELQSLIGHRGFLLFLSLLTATRQGFYAQLASIPLTDATRMAAASAIQGQIKGLDLIPNTLLELGTPAQAGEGAIA